MNDEQKNEAPLTDHDYDGIRELDNLLPTWWLAIFGGTVIFAFLYWTHYEIAGGPTSQQELAAAMSRWQSVKKVDEIPSEEKLAALFTEEASQQGRALFETRCASCHAANAGGLIGPNVTDRFWLHGQGRRGDILLTLREGVPAKGMPPWKEALKKDEQMAITAFVYSLKDTNVAGGKPGQGAEIK